MITEKDAVVIDKSAIPTGKLIGKYTFLRDMGKTLAKEKAIQITTTDAKEAKKIQNRWRSYFKMQGKSRREIQPDSKIVIHLWLVS